MASSGNDVTTPENFNCNHIAAISEACLQLLNGREADQSLYEEISQLSHHATSDGDFRIFISTTPRFQNGLSLLETMEWATVSENLPSLVRKHYSKMPFVVVIRQVQTAVLCVRSSNQFVFLHHQLDSGNTFTFVQKAITNFKQALTQPMDDVNEEIRADLFVLQKGPTPIQQLPPLNVYQAMYASVLEENRRLKAQIEARKSESHQPNSKEQPRNCQEEQDFFCPLCDTLKSLQESILLSACSHRVCRSCLPTFLTVSASLQCPVPGCGVKMSDDEAKQVLSDEQLAELGIRLVYGTQILKKMKTRARGQLTAQSIAEEVFWCELCQGWKEVSNEIKISACSHEFCSTCLSAHLTAQVALTCPMPMCQQPVTHEEALLCLSQQELDNLFVRQNFNTEFISRSHRLPGKFDCPICFDECNGKNAFMVAQCRHTVCGRCAQQFFMINVIGQNALMRCPANVGGCTADISINEAKGVLSPDEFERLQQHLFNKVANSLVKCTRPDCPGMAEVVPPLTMFTCPVCRYVMCVTCRLDWHAGSTCEAYRQWLEENGRADAAFADYVRQNRVQRCGGCGQGVSKRDGCNYMTCRCGYNFCYRCGRHLQAGHVWENHEGCSQYDQT